MDVTVLRAQWDRVAAALAATIGFVVLLLGWIGVSGEGVAVKQLPYIISGGIGGIFLLGLAAVLWLSADLRDEWRVLEEIRVALTGEADPTGELPVPVDADAAALGTVQVLVPVRTANRRAPAAAASRAATTRGTSS